MTGTTIVVESKWDEGSHMGFICGVVGEEFTRESLLDKHLNIEQIREIEITIGFMIDRFLIENQQTS